MKADPVFGWESLSEALGAGLEDLLAANWAEVATDRDCPPLDVDWPRYLQMERLGAYRGVSARKAGRLVGYVGYFIHESMRHKFTLWAWGDALYIDKDHRQGALGLKLIAAAEPLLKSVGVQFVTQGDMLADHSTTAKPRATLGTVLTRLCGYQPFDRVYIKRL